MYHIGIDVGSTYTKYCIMNEEKQIIRLYSEKTPIHQKQYFKEKCVRLKSEYPDAAIVSCGYGKKNIQAVQNISELTALAKGADYVVSAIGTILDIGGQDTKIIFQERGNLKLFFVNDKCAAGSGMFLSDTLNFLEMDFESIDLNGLEEPSIKLASICAVFAQSEIIELIADNQNETDIIQAVIWQILIKAKPLLGKVKSGPVLLSGGMALIRGLREFAEKALDQECRTTKYSPYLSAVGCALVSVSKNSV